MKINFCLHNELDGLAHCIGVPKCPLSSSNCQSVHNARTLSSDGSIQ